MELEHRVRYIHKDLSSEICPNPKSTFLNILSGLIEPNSGEISVDGVKINNNNLYSFQEKINYVPQNIFVLNDTIRKNIAFGVDNKLINNSKIINSAKLAEGSIQARRGRLARPLATIAPEKDNAS